MAYSNTPIDINTATQGISLPKELSREVWAKAVEDSAIMRFARRMELPGRGLDIPVITSGITAEIVGVETAEKHVSTPEFSNKVMSPVKIAAIVPFSDEFRRDMPQVYDQVIRDAPKAIAKTFDTTIMHAATAPKTGFDILSDATAISFGTDAYAALVSAKGSVATASARLNGWLLSPQAETALLSATDGEQRPLFINSAISEGAITRLLGEEVDFSTHAYKAGTPNVLGFAGDWDKAHYGIVEDITVKFSDQATINDGTQQVNLWQRNMFAMLIEATLGFVVEDKAAFVKLTA